MKQFFAILVLAVLILNYPISYGMEDKKEEETTITSLVDLPPEVFGVILDELTANVIIPIRCAPFQVQEDIGNGILRILSRIKKIRTFKLVCRKLHTIGNEWAKKYLNEARTYINQVGDPDEVLVMALKNGETEIAKLCMMIGADVNAIKYTAFHVPPCHGTETLFTEAVKKGEYYGIKRLFELGADPLQPNAFGERPIDIAKKRRLFHIIRLIQENGGDPDVPLLANKHDPDDHDNHNPSGATLKDTNKRPARAAYISCKQLLATKLTLIAVAGGIGYWLYKKRKKHKERRQQQEVSLNKFHGDHIEVFRGKKCHTVLNFDGMVNEAKEAAALAENRKLRIR